MSVDPHEVWRCDACGEVVERADGLHLIARIKCFGRVMPAFPDKGCFGYKTRLADVYQAAYKLGGVEAVFTMLSADGIPWKPAAGTTMTVGGVPVVVDPNMPADKVYLINGRLMGRAELLGKLK